MLVAREFVLVHIPKTGGTFLKQVCREHLAGFEEPAWHYPYSRLAPDVQERPAICFVRNPWDWYVSWFHHSQREGTWDDFEAALRHLHRHPLDHYSRLYGKYAATGGVREGKVEVGRFENLRHDFVAFLDRHEVEVPGLRDAVLSAPPVRVTPDRADYRDYYTDETREMVARTRMARRFGYEF